MTEIPEHLLKRSRERRSAIGGGDGDDASSSAPATTTAAATPATGAAPAAPARPEAVKPVAPPPPKPDPPYIKAAKQRKKIPFWVGVPLAILPVWSFMYIRSIQDQSVAVEGPRAAGATVYGSCSSCHGAEGQGGAGRPLSNGQALLTFPAIQDQLRWVLLGTDRYKAAAVTIYGNPDREGGAHLTGSFGVMPGWQGQLTDAEILAVTCYVRYDLSGADPNSDTYSSEYAQWCAPEAPKYTALEQGKTFADPDFANVGTTPQPGRSTPFPADAG